MADQTPLIVSAGGLTRMQAGDTIPVASGGTGAATAAANTVLAGPVSGGAAAPSFRALGAADIPNEVLMWMGL